MKRFGIIGLGNMGGAIARGLAPGTSFTLLGFDPHEGTRDALSNSLTILPSSRDVAGRAEYLLLAVKPQILHHVLEEIVPALNPGTCLISIAAGITLRDLVTWSKNTYPVVRVMPNTPAMIGKGVYALCFDHALLTDEIKDTVTAAFASIGQAHVLPESLFDAFTGLIGSGPAYVFAFMEALIDAGVTLGLPRTQASAMVKGLLSGSALMAEDEATHPTLLKEMVTSPGGTTIAGLNALDQLAFRHAVSQAVQAAARRSKDLGA